MVGGGIKGVISEWELQGKSHRRYLHFQRQGEWMEDVDNYSGPLVDGGHWNDLFLHV